MCLSLCRSLHSISLGPFLLVYKIFKDACVKKKMGLFSLEL